jgi:hypothetical protein
MIDWTDSLVKDCGGKRRLYRMRCDSCLVDRGYQRPDVHGLGLCKSCASSATHKGKLVSEHTKYKMSQNHYLNNGGQHPWTGRQHSNSTKEQLRKRQIEYCTTHGNQFAGHRHSKDTIAKLSEISSGKAPQWKGKVFLYSGPKGSFKLRSSYELAYANWMDENNIDWYYEPQFKLSSGKIFSPDFQLSTGDIIEIKGYWTKTALDKWHQFCLEYPDLKKIVLMKSDLLQLNLEVK